MSQDKFKWLLTKMETIYDAAVSRGVNFHDNDEFAIAKSLIKLVETKQERKRPTLRIVPDETTSGKDL